MAIGDIAYLTGLSCYLIIENDNQEWLFVHRSNTGYQDQRWGLPGGHVKENEPIPLATAREAFEEIGITVDPSDLEFAFILQRNKASENITDRVDFYLKTKKWSGTPRNAEPAVHDEIRWISPLDSEYEFMDFIGAASRHILDGKRFATFGWTDDHEVN